ncbi:MAG: YicC/YloC family endoribonuclease [Deltaproteobacteria bacterium]|nr:YicC/YloC family endoribonuclease [Deltaproteobacteria bacterium]
MRSMTGFGRAQVVVSTWSVVVEVKTVNHKGLDVKLRLPRSLASHESALAQQVRARLERGRVDVAVDLEAQSHESTIRIDPAKVAAVVAAVKALAELHPEIEASLSASDLLKMPGVLTHDDAPQDLKALQEATSTALQAALNDLDTMRSLEGEGLHKELTQRSHHCKTLVEEIATQTNSSSSEKRQRLHDRLTVLGDTIDPARLAAEAALLLERLDVSEELARLRLHLDALDVLLGRAGGGRKLDFLCQELLREANTTASKCQDAAVAQRVVDLKAEIERIREQAQNIE